MGTLAKDWPTALELYSVILEGYPIGCNLLNIQRYIVSGYPCEGLSNSIRTVVSFWKGTLLVVTYEISNVTLSVGTLAKDWPTALELYSVILEGYPIDCNL